MLNVIKQSRCNVVSVDKQTQKRDGLYNFIIHVCILIRTMCTVLNDS